MTSDDQRRAMPMTSSIAIVEDDPLIIQFLCEVLGDEGYAVRVYSDGRSAVAAIIAQPRRWCRSILNCPR